LPADSDENVPQDYVDQADINSPRNQTDSDDKPEQEENKRIIQTRQSEKRQKIGTAKSGGADDEESYEEESEEEKMEYDGWLRWDETKATQMSASDEPESQKRAHYRLGLIKQQKGDLQGCLTHFYTVTELDPEFCKQQVNLRIAEICYKLNNIDESFRTMAKVEGQLRPNDAYMVCLLKGKCFDKINQYHKAALDYETALNLAKEQNLGNSVIGQIEFRLGWSTIRSKVDVEKGIEHLKKSNELLPENTEIMIKLAGVLFQENGTQEEALKCKQLLIKAINLEPNNAEAALLQGKVYHKLGEW